MIINQTYGFIFIHIPKSAGTTVTNVLSKLSRWCDLEIGGTPLGEAIQPYYAKRYGLRKHSRALEIKKVVGEEFWQRCFKFAFVRNPYTRVYSAFNFLKKWENIPEDHAKIINKFENFEEFILSGILQEYKGPDNMFLPQVHWVTAYPQEIKLIIDFVGKVENLKEDLKLILAKLGLLDEAKELNELPHLNKSVEFDWKVYDNPSVVDIVYSHYKVDFEMFDYEKDVDKFLNSEEENE
jgi:hypothetical protein